MSRWVPLSTAQHSPQERIADALTRIAELMDPENQITLHVMITAEREVGLLSTIEDMPVDMPARPEDSSIFKEMQGR